MGKSWIENYEKGQKGGQKQTEKRWQMPETDKRGPNCLKRDQIDQKGSKDL